MTVLKGDNLEILKTIESSSIDLIYMDPPFFTQKTQKLSNNKNYLITKILCIHSKIRGLRLRITKNFCL